MTRLIFGLFLGVAGLGSWFPVSAAGRLIVRGDAGFEIHGQRGPSVALFKYRRCDAGAGGSIARLSCEAGYRSGVVNASQAVAAGTYILAYGNSFYPGLIEVRDEQSTTAELVSFDLRSVTGAERSLRFKASRDLGNPAEQERYLNRVWGGIFHAQSSVQELCGAGQRSRGLRVSAEALRARFCQGWSGASASALKETVVTFLSQSVTLLRALAWQLDAQDLRWITHADFTESSIPEIEDALILPEREFALEQAARIAVFPGVYAIAFESQDAQTGVMRMEERLGVKIH